jgi:hypothetical protein
MARGAPSRRVPTEIEIEIAISVETLARDATERACQGCGGENVIGRPKASDGGQR